ncbi:hypothetical protein [Catenovulum maritimum]|uniref:Prephenate dehydrogenase n=1 Tax=Catenovulum maritimum TaxID=1513271 RepID=A0A0J8GWK1_9ALTE|nr:hypothetical protein [Catenovulum maritimum]KMT65674.1 hypothetical protein XM47_08245 [Catenovulum maritimum]
MQNIIEALRQSLATAYKQAIDCDKFLDEIQEQGHGKYKAIFTTGFEAKSDRFLPYVEEVGKAFYELTENHKTDFSPEAIKPMVKQLEIIFATQAKFINEFNNADKMH